MDVMAEVGACCVAEVMGTELYTLTPDTVVASARRLAFDNGIDHLLVLDNGTLTGIVCREDLRTAQRHAGSLKAFVRTGAAGLIRSKSWTCCALTELQQYRPSWHAPPRKPRWLPKSS